MTDKAELKFAGFTPATSDFLWGLAFNNEREWFLAHKDEFERVLNTPFKALAADTFTLMHQRFPKRDIQLHIAYIATHADCTGAGHIKITCGFP